MSLPASVLEAMAAAGCSLEQIVATAKAHEKDNSEKLAEKREQNRIRQQNHRARNAASRVTNVTSVTDLSPKKEIPPTPPKEKTTPIRSEAKASSPQARATKSEFEIWYGNYPHKVQRGAAEKAFLKARSLASLTELVAGVDRYIAEKPADVQWRNPATWLNGKGWLDAPAITRFQHATAPPNGRRMNAVEANLSRRIQKIEPASGRRDHGDDELFPPDKSRLPSSVVDLGKAFAWRGGSGDH